MGIRELSLDTETTGFSYDNGDRIVEVGIVELMDRKPTGNVFHRYMDPGFELSDEVVKIHGLTREQLIESGGGETFAHVADDLLEFINGDMLIIHNASFDMGFLDKELAAVGRPTLSSQAKVFDTLSFAGMKFPGARNSLDALCRRYGIDNSQRTFHGALLDAELLAEVYLCLTRQQNDLNFTQSDAAPASNQASLLTGIDRIEAMDLPVIKAQGKEVDIHDDYLRKLVERASQPPVWAPAQPLAALSSAKSAKPEALRPQGSPQAATSRRRMATPAPF